jgi:murein tripeptide amidase MpaA
MHGGYEWNTILLAYEVIDYFMQFPDQIPDSASVMIIPNVNPDGQFKVVGHDGRFTSDDILDKRWEATFPGRFNANDVDLNRNWDCLWTENAFWRNQPINAGEHPFF